MPLHDWSRQPAGNFHAFHNAWIAELQKALNRGLLPAGFMALGEQWAGDIGPDVLTLRTGAPVNGVEGGILLAEREPKVRLRYDAPSDAAWYAAKRQTIVIRHVSGQEIIAVMEIVSPGNIQSRSAVRTFVEKLSAIIARGIHAIVIDLFAPGSADSEGLHALIWEQISGEVITAAERTAQITSYRATSPATAFVEPVEIGVVLPEMPLFLTPDVYVNVPLEATYQAAWDGMPIVIQQQLSTKPV